MSTDKNNLVYQEQLDDNVIEMLSEDIGNNYSLRTENTRNVVGALNEIKGKDIISNAVGSPLLITDTFEVMGDKIKGLSNSFKTALLRLGISVSSIDKFEKLIEKLELYVDENASDTDVEEALLESLRQTLRDNGIEINGNETLAELIVKVGEGFESKAGIDIITASELPVNGRENQICVITEEEVGNIVVCPNSTYTTINNNDVFVQTMSNLNKNICAYNSGNMLVHLPISKTYIKLNDMLLTRDSYIYRNGSWELFTLADLVIIDSENGGAQVPLTLHSGKFDSSTNELYIVHGGTAGSSYTRDIASTTDSFPLASYSKLLITYGTQSNAYTSNSRIECQIINKESDEIIKTITLTLASKVDKKTVTTSIEDIKNYEVYIKFKLILVSGCNGNSDIYDVRFEQ